MQDIGPGFIIRRCHFARGVMHGLTIYFLRFGGPALREEFEYDRFETGLCATNTEMNQIITYVDHVLLLVLCRFYSSLPVKLGSVRASSTSKHAVCKLVAKSLTEIRVLGPS